jgi:hypothetical protein
MEMVVIILAIFTVFAGLLTWWFVKPQNSPGNIKITRIEGHLPATTFFELQIPETDDSLFIHFGDKSPVTYVKPAEKTAAHIYYIPGVFTVSVHTRQQALLQQVFI